jgi:hypothetical protein
LAGNSVYSEPETSGQNDFDKKFREGRDLIDREEWARGAEKFREVIEKYPNGKSIDAAHYWLAFCHKKQKQYKEANAALDESAGKISGFVVGNGRARDEVGNRPPLGKIYSSNMPSLLSAASTINSPADVLKGNPVTVLTEHYERLSNGEVYTSAAATARVPLDREDEIKIAAFQSLLYADPKRAIETMGEIFKPGSKASETLKQEALRVLQSPRSSGTQTMIFTATAAESPKNSCRCCAKRSSKVFKTRQI